MIKVIVLKDMQDCQRLRGAWQALTEHPAEGIFRLGVCMSFEWTMALWKNHLGGQPQHVLVAEEAGEVLAILPCYSHRTGGILGLRPLTLSAFPELYYTRAGLLCRPDRPDAIAALLTYRGSEWAGWTRLVVSVVEGSPSQQLLVNAIQTTRLSYSTEVLPTSPYIELAPSEEQFFAGLDKKFHGNLRNKERNFSRLGYINLTIYEKIEDVPHLLSAIEQIERASWKEKVGTSITKNPVQDGFYKSLFLDTYASKWLFSVVLYVDENPVAYQLGLLFNDAFELLKTSYVEEYSRYGLGNILIQKMIYFLLKKNIYYYDLQGKTEQHKMKWTKKTYCHVRYLIYHEGLFGYSLNLRQKFLINKKETDLKKE